MRNTTDSLHRHMRRLEAQHRASYAANHTTDFGSTVNHANLCNAYLVALHYHSEHVIARHYNYGGKA